MEREEYKTKLDEVRELLRRGEKEEAYDLLDNMNWRKVHNVNALLNAAEIYESGNKLSQARELLELAHERSPIGRMVIYRLALICIRLESFDEAKEYYDEFVEIAPHDSLKYIIKYQLNKAKGADDLTLIGILEELKAHDFHEEWAYELALLYHKTGQVDKCIAACDELILWFGEGPYVESALELKLLHHPLDSDQENKYRAYRARRDGVTEIRPGDQSSGGEILTHAIEIPEVEISNEKFNTGNLQEAIKKNIEEIMQATEAGEVSENMEAIKELVGDLPFTKVVEKAPTEELPVIQAEEKKINQTLELNFREYLEEEYDGQMSLFVPDMPEVEPQVAGQMSIDEIMADWERTSRAAEAALKDAEQQRLENAKAKAIEEAQQIMERIEDAKTQLDAGVAPSDLLKKEYLSTPYEPANEKPAVAVSVEPAREAVAEPEESGKEVTAAEASAVGGDTRRLPDVAEKEALSRQDTFRIPKVAPEGGNQGVGLEIPIVSAEGAVVMAASPQINAGEGLLAKSASLDRRKWEPKDLEKKEERTGGENGRLNSADVTKIVAGANDLLQQTIDQYGEIDTTAGLPEVDEDVLAASVAEMMQADTPEKMTAMKTEQEKELQQPPRHAEVPEPARKVAPPDAFEEEIDRKPEEALDAMLVQATGKPQPKAEMTDTPVESPLTVETQGDAPVYLETQTEDPVVILPEDLLLEEVQTIPVPEENLSDTKKQKPLVPDELPHKDSTTDLRRQLENKIEIQDSALENAIRDELPQKELTREERELFTYFTPIGGMETALCQVLTGARARLTRMKGSRAGNIIIQGGKGSGKTTLATSLIHVLQLEIDKPNRNIGKIDGANLNGKDISKLFTRLDGGCLIIEKAGDIARDMTMEMSVVMEQDNINVLVILEDSRAGIEKVLGLNPQFARKFTEKIIIPVLTIDELVNFGKSYATEMGYSIDEMGVLALYDRINLIQRLDHPTNLTEVKEIVDEAIDKAERGGFAGFFGRKRRDQDGNLILQEKDFQER